MKERLKQIITELKAVGLNVSDEFILDKAVSIYITEIINSSNKSKFAKTKTSTNELATEKQLNFIYKNNIDVNTDKLTKIEATKLIKEYIEKHGEKETI